MTLSGVVGLGRPGDWLAASHGAARRSSDFSRKKSRNPDFYMKSRDLLMSLIDLIFGKILCRPSKIYLTWLQPTDHSFVEESESEITQSCQPLCDPVDCSPSGSSIHGIFQARILEWVAISLSRGSSQPRDQTQASHIAGRRFTI